MYKIIIVEGTNQSYKELVKGKQHNIEYVKKDNLDNKLQRKEYDIIYIPKEIVRNELIDKTLNDYEIVPNILKKLDLNSDYITLTNIQVLNKLILDNIDIIQFKNNFEITLIAYEIRKKLTSEQLSICQKYAQIYKENYVDLINEGTLYHLSNPRNSNHMCMEVVNKNKDKAMILYVNKESEMLGGNNFVKFQGLNDKYLYKNDLDNKVYSGEYLRKVGLNIFSNKSYWNAFKGTLIKLNRLEEN